MGVDALKWAAMHGMKLVGAGEEPPPEHDPDEVPAQLIVLEGNKRVAITGYARNGDVEGEIILRVEP